MRATEQEIAEVAGRMKIGEQGEQDGDEKYQERQRDRLSYPIRPPAAAAERARELPQEPEAKSRAGYAPSTDAETSRGKFQPPDAEKENR